MNRLPSRVGKLPDGINGEARSAAADFNIMDLEETVSPNS